MKKVYKDQNLWSTILTLQQRVVAVLLFRCKCKPGVLATLVLLLSFAWQPTALAQSASPASVSNPPVIDHEDGGFLAEITVNSPEEVEQALRRAEQLFEQGAVDDATGPATFILYGPEVSIFLKENYQQHKTIVDLAARLSAFQVVDIRVCEIRLGMMGHDKEAIHPFVGTVPYGPGEVNRLIKEEHYRYF